MGTALFLWVFKVRAKVYSQGRMLSSSEIQNSGAQTPCPQDALLQQRLEGCQLCPSVNTASPTSLPGSATHPVPSSLPLTSCGLGQAASSLWSGCPGAALPDGLGSQGTMGVRGFAFRARTPAATACVTPSPPPVHCVAASTGRAMSTT